MAEQSYESPLSPGQICTHAAVHLRNKFRDIPDHLLGGTEINATIFQGVNGFLERPESTLLPVGVNQLLEAVLSKVSPTFVSFQRDLNLLSAINRGDAAIRMWNEWLERTHQPPLLVDTIQQLVLARALELTWMNHRVTSEPAPTFRPNEVIEFAA